MPSPDVSALSSAFIEGASVFGKAVLNWDLRSQGIQVRTNVKAPQAMTKLSAVGSPRPYRKQDDFNSVKFEDRRITVFQSKYDFEFDSEEFRNTYLATLPEMPFSEAAVEQASKQYLDALIANTLYSGVRNATGSGAADVCDGWGTIIAAEIVAGKLAPVATGAIDNTNAVAKVKAVVSAAPVWLKKQGGMVLVSYEVFDMYAENYASLFGFQFNPSATGEYRINNTNFVLRPADFMGTSQRIIATVKDNLVFGSDIENVTVYSTPHLNILQNRLMMPAGCQIQDLDALIVNDVA